MASILSNIQERVERSIYERIRESIVFHGFYPDITNYNNTQTDWNQLQSDIDSIVNNKGFAVDLFGHGDVRARGEKKSPRIVLHTRRMLPGTLGLESKGIDLDNQGNYYIKKKWPHNSSLLHVEIYLISNDAAQDRILNALIGDSLSTLKYVDFWDADKMEEKFLVEQIDYADDTNLEKGYLERILTYEVPDLFPEPEIINNQIAKIKEINVDTHIDELDTNADDFTVK